MSPMTPAHAAASSAGTQQRGGDVLGSPLWRTSPHKNVVPGVVTATRAPPRAQASTTAATASPLPERKGNTANTVNSSNASGNTGSSGTVVAATTATPARFDKEANKRKQLQAIMEQPFADLAQLRKLCWSGIASDLRPPIWRLLLGCVPTKLERRTATVARKRSEYQQLLPEYEKTDRSEYEAEQLKQIEKDVPRPQLRVFDVCLFVGSDFTVAVYKRRCSLMWLCSAHSRARYIFGRYATPLLAMCRASTTSSRCSCVSRSLKRSGRVGPPPSHRRKCS